MISRGTLYTTTLRDLSHTDLQIFRGHSAERCFGENARNILISNDHYEKHLTRASRVSTSLETERWLRLSSSFLIFSKFVAQFIGKSLERQSERGNKHEYEK